MLASLLVAVFSQTSIYSPVCKESFGPRVNQDILSYPKCSLRKTSCPGLQHLCFSELSMRDIDKSFSLFYFLGIWSQVDRSYGRKNLKSWTTWLRNVTLVHVSAQALISLCEPPQPLNTSSYGFGKHVA